MSSASGQPRKDVAVYCINLIRSAERRRHMEAQFAAAGWLAGFIPAIDGHRDVALKELRSQQIVAADASGVNGPIEPAEVACYLSHERIWRMVLRQRLTAAIICEDDICFRQPLLCLESFFDALPADADLVYLHYMNGSPDQAVAPAFHIDQATPHARCGHHAFYQAWACGGTQSYCVTRTGADKLLRLARPVRYPVDGFLSRASAENRLVIYAIFPMPVLLAEFAGDSTIWPQAVLQKPV